MPSPQHRHRWAGRRGALVVAGLAVAGLAVAGLAVAGCGASTPSSSSTSSASGEAQAVTATTMTWSPPGTFGTEPSVVVPSGTPPTQLLSKDLIAGTGATAQAGDELTVQYIGYSWTTKKEFDASWSRGQPLPFELGVGAVIPGWDQGVAGMKVGGRRELVIPPGLAYGDKSPTPAIATNDTLIFIVDLLTVSPASSTSTTAP